MSMEAPRRFYKEARLSADAFGVALDARALKTPGGAVVKLPTRALAEAVAAEWEAQGETLTAWRMPLTRLVNVAIDQTPLKRDALAAHVAKYGETDLLCHRAEAPPALVERQSATWDPILAWAEGALGVRLPVVVGVIAADVPVAELEKLRAAAAALDDFRLTGLAHAVGVAGSVLIGFALLHGRLDGEAAFAAAAHDELWSLEKWGEDDEARRRVERMRDELKSLARYFTLLIGEGAR
jgi:chaperone required for assembly of F1-ATPase